MEEKTVIVIAVRPKIEEDDLSEIFGSDLCDSYRPKLKEKVLIAIISVNYEEGQDFSEFITKTRSKTAKLFGTQKITLAVV